MNSKRILFLITFLIIFSAFVEASDKDYFPYDEGRTWEYETIVEGHPAENYRVTSTSLTPIETKDGKIMVIEGRSKWPSTGKQDTVFLYYMNDSKGLNLIGIGKQWTPNPIINWSNLQYIVHYPIRIGSSTKWEGNDFSNKYTVENINATITVPAGTFKDCLVIKVDKVWKVKGKTNKLSRTSGYAKEVGNVKNILSFGDKKEITQLVSYSYIEK